MTEQKPTPPPTPTPINTVPPELQEALLRRWEQMLEGRCKQGLPTTGPRAW